MLSVLLMASISFAQAQMQSTLTCYDGKEKLIEMSVKSATFTKNKQVEVVDQKGNAFTVLNLTCSLK